jgi:maltose alpha-D-glucosyltransferase/alpha-amylase
MAYAVPDARPLAEYIKERRWFRSKTREIVSTDIEDVIALPNESARFMIVRLNYAEGDCDHYLLTDNSPTWLPVEALDDQQFRSRLLDAFAHSATFRGQHGELRFSRTKAFPENVTARKLESSVSRAEQSNTSIIYGNQFIFKLFRKIEPGTNPDVEIGAFLTEQGFTHTPAVLGTLEYRSNKGQIYSAGILQQFVKNKGDAWKYTLEALSGFFDRATGEGFVPLLPNQHPLDRAKTELPENIRKLIGDYLLSAALLGRRTAEMHLALAAGEGNADFAAEPFTPEAGRKLHEEMLAQADIAFETLRRKQATLSGEAGELAKKLLHLENRITERFSALRDHRINTSRIRFHGDYHLGQVLYTGSDFMIIDFEGEPARPLHERRTKTLAMRDVAGMLRSFQYAAYAALFDRALSRQDLEGWADTWNAWVSAEYLKAYLRAAEKSVFLPANENEQRILLDAFVLHKALYEVAYEMNNRPDWVRIPLRGILSLVS